MRYVDLPSPGAIANAIKIRVEAAKAISGLEVVAARRPGGKVAAASDLKAFFTACASALDSLIDAVAPTVSSRVVANAAPTKIVLTFSEAMSQTKAPPASAFAVTGTARTVTSVAWGTAGNAGKLEITVNSAFANGNTINLAYTKPAGVSRLRDLAGNDLASFTATAVTNNVA